MATWFGSPPPHPRSSDWGVMGPPHDCRPHCFQPSNTNSSFQPDLCWTLFRAPIVSDHQSVGPPDEPPTFWIMRSAECGTASYWDGFGEKVGQPLENNGKVCVALHLVKSPNSPPEEISFSRSILGVFVCYSSSDCFFGCFPNRTNFVKKELPCSN